MIDLGLQKILLTAGILNYLFFVSKMLWKLSVMFHSQPHSVAVSFVVPSVAMYAFVQRYTAGEANETVSDLIFLSLIESAYFHTRVW